MTSLNIFFDWYGLQVQNHLDNQYERLKPMITAIDGAGWASNLDSSNLTNTTNSPNTKQTLDKVDLSKYDVLVLTSRVLVNESLRVLENCLVYSYEPFSIELGTIS